MDGIEKETCLGPRGRAEVPQLRGEGSWQKAAALACAACGSSPRAIRNRRLGDTGRLRLIERALQVGDAEMAGWNLRDWGEGLEASLDEDVRLRVRAARLRLQELLAHEAAHGRFSLLDRNAPQIARHEREMRLRGLPSRFGPPQGGGGDENPRACSTASS